MAALRPRQVFFLRREPLLQSARDTVDTQQDHKQKCRDDELQLPLRNSSNQAYAN